MTWATKDTNKKLELVPDKDPTCGGLVPPEPAEPGGGWIDMSKFESGGLDLSDRSAIAAMETIDPTVYYDKSALDCLKEHAKFYRPEAKSISPFAGPYGPGSLAAAYPSSSPTYKYPWDHLEVDELRRDIANLRLEIAELRKVFRRAMTP
jgi:hypothetical protein